MIFNRIISIDAHGQVCRASPNREGKTVSMVDDIALVRPRQKMNHSFVFTPVSSSTKEEKRVPSHVRLRSQIFHFTISRLNSIHHGSNDGRHGSKSRKQ